MSAAAVYYIPPPPHPVPADYDAFLASLSANERELVEIAKGKLGSSFFVQWSRAYLNWKKKQALPKPTPTSH